MRPLLTAILFTFVMFEVSATQWIQRNNIPAVGRHRATAIGLGNKGYMGMGHYNGSGPETYFADWWEFDPATNSWSQKADYPGNNGNGELGCHTWTYDNKVYVGLGEVQHLVLYRFDPELNAWEQMSNAPTGNNFQDTQEMINGAKAYFTDLIHDELFEYDCVTDSWTLLGNLPFSWYFSYSGFTYDNKCWVKADMLMYMYDPALNQWYQVVSAGVYPGQAVRASNSFFINDKFYIANGYGQTHSDLIKEVWEFDPLTFQWTQLEDFPGTARRYSKSFVINEKAYIGTGTNGTNFNDLWEFNKYLDLEEESTSSLIAFPNPATDHIQFNDLNQHEFSIEIYDFCGKMVASKTTTTGKLNVLRNGLPAGTYTYQQKIDQRIIRTEKFIFI